MTTDPQTTPPAKFMDSMSSQIGKLMAEIQDFLVHAGEKIPETLKHTADKILESLSLLKNTPTSLNQISATVALDWEKLKQQFSAATIKLQPEQKLAYLQNLFKQYYQDVQETLSRYYEQEAQSLEKEIANLDQALKNDD